MWLFPGVSIQLAAFSKRIIPSCLPGPETRGFESSGIFLFFLSKPASIIWHAFHVWYLVTDCFLAAFCISKWELRVCKQMRFQCAADVAFCVS